MGKRVGFPEVNPESIRNTVLRMLLQNNANPYWVMHFGGYQQIQAVKKLYPFQEPKTPLTARRLF